MSVSTELQSPTQRLAAIAIIPMVAVTAWVSLTSDHLQWPVASALYWGYMTGASMAVGLYWWVRRPASRFGPLLVAFGGVCWLTGWTASDWPLVFDLATLAEPAFACLTFYLFLAFPMGRLEPGATRWLFGILLAAVALGWPPHVLWSPMIASGAPLAACTQPCPENLFQIGTNPWLATVPGRIGVAVILAVVVATAVVYLLRLRAASRPRRRTMLAVAVSSLLFLPAFFAFHFANQILKLGPEVVEPLQWAAIVGRALLPLGFLIALVTAEVFAVRALRALLERLTSRPTPSQWRDAIAEALDDPALRLGSYDPGSGRFLEPSGEELEPTPHRSLVTVDAGSRPLAAMLIDDTLAEDPELVRAAASATLLAVENGALEARALRAGDAERRRIQRDLHDSAQQRLVALRIHLMLATERLDDSAQRKRFERLGGEIELAIDDLRDVTNGPARALLAEAGPAKALEAVAAHSPITVTVWDSGLGRHPRPLEHALYFCCLESLQNAAKHAGPDARVTIRLGQLDGHVGFCVEDDGSGFDPAAVRRGAGLRNLEDRVAAIGGTLRIDSRPGGGTRVIGGLPTIKG